MTAAKSKLEKCYRRFHSTVQPYPSPPVAEFGTAFEKQYNENILPLDKYKSQIEEKDKVIEELQEKIRSLEVREKDLKKESVKLKTEIKAVNTELEKTREKVSEYCNENTNLSNLVSNYRDLELTNSDVLEKYNSLKRKHDEVLEKVKAFEKREETETEEGEKDETEEIDAEVIVQLKNSGFRRTTPAGPSAPAASDQSVQPKLKKCAWCSFETSDSNILDKHMGEKHHRCDECHTSFKTTWSLREHNKNIHKKINGTMMCCDTCHFSAVNKAHLNLHMNSCHKSQARGNKRNVTCRFWRRDNCNNSQCEFKHEMINCRYGSTCRKGSSCSYAHFSKDNAESHEPRQHAVNPWINPAFQNKQTFDKEFPFLGEQIRTLEKMCRQLRNQGL